MLEDKLQTLLKQLSWEEDKNSYFTEGKVEKIVGDNTHSHYTFVIRLKEVLPPSIFQEFIDKLKDAFPDIESVRVAFRVENPDYTKIKEYFSYLMHRYSVKCPILESLEDSPVEWKEDTLIIPVDNIAEEQKIMSLEKKIITDFRSFGYPITRINPVLKEEPETVLEESEDVVVDLARLEQKEPVEPVNNYKKNYRPKKIETEDHPDVVLGRLIDTSVTRLDTIAGPTNGVTLEAELFGIDVRETKTDLIIVTLKITDYTDSIYAKIFVNDAY